MSKKKQSKTKTRKFNRRKEWTYEELKEAWEKEDLAHEGTEEAIEKLKRLIALEKNENEKGLLECALEECQFFYYSPENKKEEKEFRIKKLIERKDRKLVDLYIRRDKLQYDLEIDTLEREIDRDLFRKTKDRRIKEEAEMYKYTDFRKMLENDLVQAEEEIKYLEEFIKVAGGEIKSEKYKSIPWGVLNSMHDDYEDWDEENSDEQFNEEDIKVKEPPF